MHNNEVNLGGGRPSLAAAQMFMGSRAHGAKAA